MNKCDLCGNGFMFEKKWKLYSGETVCNFCMKKSAIPLKFSFKKDKDITIEFIKNEIERNKPTISELKHANLNEQQNKSDKNTNIPKCPNCSSTDIDFMQNNRKNFSVGKAIGGVVLTGGVGSLAGFTGKKGKNEWYCKNCGTVFETKK